MLPESPQADVQELILPVVNVVAGCIEHLCSRPRTPLSCDRRELIGKVAEVLIDDSLSHSQMLRWSVGVLLPHSCMFRCTNDLV